MTQRSGSNDQKSAGGDAEYKLLKSQILRFKATNTEPLSLKLTSGSAEISGIELKAGATYSFDPASEITVTTSNECVISIKGDVKVTSDAEENLMHSCMHVHEILEFMRDAAEFTNNVGPVVMIVGPEPSHNSAFVRALLNHAVRSERTPLLIDISLDNGTFLPGTIGMCLVEQCTRDRHTFSTGEAELYLHEKNLTLYESLIEILGKEASSKLKARGKVRSSGAIINTCGRATRCGHRYLRTIAKIMKATVVIVIGDKKLHEKLLWHTPKPIQTLFVPELEKCAGESQTERSRLRDRVRKYFHQPSQRNDKETTYSFDVPFSDLKIYRNKEGKKCKLTAVSNVDELTQLQLLAAYPGPVSKKKAPFRREVGEFICIKDIGVDTSKFTLLSRKPPPLSKNLVFIATNIQYIS